MCAIDVVYSLDIYSYTLRVKRTRSDMETRGLDVPGGLRNKRSCLYNINIRSDRSQPSSVVPIYIYILQLSTRAAIIITQNEWK